MGMRSHLNTPLSQINDVTSAPAGLSLSLIWKYPVDMSATKKFLHPCWSLAKIFSGSRCGMGALRNRCFRPL